MREKERRGECRKVRVGNRQENAEIEIKIEIVIEVKEEKKV